MMSINASPMEASGNSSSYSIEQVVKAITCILSPSSSALDRASAHNLCEEIKQGPLAADYGFHLAQNLAMPLGVRLFGLNVLEEHVRGRMRLEEAPRLRDGLWNLLGLVVEVPGAERRLMQDKCAMLVAQLALRIWPQYWPDFFDRLLELISTTISTVDMMTLVRTEMGLLMARMIVDEVHPREGMGLGSATCFIWDEGRRPELQKALILVLPAIIERLYLIVPECSQIISTNDDNKRRFISTVLETWSSLCWWVPLSRKETVACQMALLQIVSQEASEELRNCALESFASFAARPGRPVETDLLQGLFDELVGPLGQLFGTLATNCTSTRDEEVREASYEAFRKLSDAWITLAATHMGHRKSPIIPKRLDAILDILLSLASFPSLLISSAVDVFWASLGKSERLLKEAAVVQRLPAIFLHCLVTLALTKDLKGNPLNRLDFYGESSADFAGGDNGREGEADFDALFLSHQNRTMDLLRHISLQHPARMVEFCAESMRSFLAGVETGNVVINVGSVGLRQWDALVHAADAVLKSVHVRLAEDGELREEIGREVEKLAGLLFLDLQKMHPEMLCLWFVAMRMLMPCLGSLGSRHFSPLMERLFTLALQYNYDSSNQNISDEKMVFAVRARATSAIARVVHAHPSLFVPALEYLIGLFRERTRPESPVEETKTEGEMSERLRQVRMLTEVLLVVTGAIEGATQRQELVKLIIEPLAIQIQRVVKGPFNSPTDLLSSLGIDVVTMSTPKATTLWRRSINGLLMWLLVVMKELKRLAVAGEVKSIINQQFVPMVNPFILQAIEIIHSLYSTHASIVGSDDGDEGLDVAAGNGQSSGLLPAVEKAMDGELMAESVESIGGRSLRGWFYMVRVSLYMGYGQLWSLAPSVMFSDASSPLRLLNQIVSLTQWTLIVRHSIQPILIVASMATTVNQQNIKNVATPLLMAVVTRLGLGYLENAWTQHTIATSTTTIDNNSSETATAREVARDRLLSAATSTILGLLYDLAVPAGERDKRTDPTMDVALLRSSGPELQRLLRHPENIAAIADPSNNALSLFIFKCRLDNNGLTDQILNLLMAMLRWKTSLTINKVLAIIGRWLPVLVVANGGTGSINTVYHDILFRTLIEHLLRGLGNSSMAEMHPNMIAIFTELYKWQMILGYDVVDLSIVSLSLSSITGQSIPQALRDYFIKTPLPISAKAQRNLVKATLVKAIQQQSLVAGGVTSTIPKLPDRLVILRKIKTALGNDDGNASLDLASLFDQPI